LGPSKTTPTTGGSVITRSADQQRLPRCSHAQDSSFSQQPRCVLIAPHISSRSSTRWRRRLRSAGPAALLPMNPTPARLLPPATLGWQAPGDLAMLPSLRDYGGGGGAGNKLNSSRWRSRLRSAGHAALPPATARSPPPATLGWRAPGDPPLPSAGSSTSARLEVATTAAAATAAELPALRRCHCEAAAVIHRRAVGTRLAVSQKSVGSPLAVRPQQSQASQQPASG
jgi:hypothetical protein